MLIAPTLLFSMLNPVWEFDPATTSDFSVQGSDDRLATKRDEELMADVGIGFLKWPSKGESVGGTCLSEKSCAPGFSINLSPFDSIMVAVVAEQEFSGRKKGCDEDGRPGGVEGSIIGFIGVTSFSPTHPGPNLISAGKHLSIFFEATCQATGPRFAAKRARLLVKPCSE